MLFIFYFIFIINKNYLFSKNVSSLKREFFKLGRTFDPIENRKKQIIFVFDSVLKKKKFFLSCSQGYAIKV